MPDIVLKDRDGNPVTYTANAVNVLLADGTTQDFAPAEGGGASAEDIQFGFGSYYKAYTYSSSGTKSYTISVVLPANAKVIKVLYGDKKDNTSDSSSPCVTSISEATDYVETVSSTGITVKITRSYYKSYATYLTLAAAMTVLYVLEE